MKFDEEFYTEMKRLYPENLEWGLVGILTRQSRVYTLSFDSKILSGLFEIFCEPIVRKISERHGMRSEKSGQTMYPDFTLSWDSKFVGGNELFRVSDWRELLAKSSPDDFVYMDPPYIGRHTDYYNHWSEEDAINLARSAETLTCGFALSMWKENKYRENFHISSHWNQCILKTYDHFYHVGSKEKFRN